VGDESQTGDSGQKTPAGGAESGKAAIEPDPAVSPTAPKPPENVANPNPNSAIGDSFVGRAWILILALTLVVLALAVFVVLIQIWPATTGSSNSFLTHHVVLGIHTTLNVDTNLMLVAVFSGAIGGLLHSLRSIAWYVGQRELKWSWILFYACLPVVAGILALLFFFLLRGGLITTEGSAKDINPYGVAAIAGLVGLFSDQAAEMLKKVFSNIFTPAPEGSDTASAVPAKK
jgi:hypothetical protein